MKRLFILLVVLLVASLIITGCEKATTSTAPKTSAVVTTPAAKTTPAPTTATAAMSASPALMPQYGGTLRMITVGGLPVAVGSPAEIEQATSTFEWWCLPVYDRLFNRTLDFRPLPGLVRSWEISSDKTNITLQLLQGVKFQDGTDFNAAAVKFNLETQAKTPTGKGPLSIITSCNIINDYTIQLNLSKFNSTLLPNVLWRYWGWMGSPTAMQKQATAETIAQLHTVGTGPFKFAGFQRTISLRMERWDGYREKGKPYLDAIQVNQLADATAALMAFKAGEAEFLNNVAPKDAVGLKKDGFVITRNDAYWMWAMVPDSANSESPWSNVKVRQAVQYAIDTKAIAKNLGEEMAEGVSYFSSARDPVYVPGLERLYDLQKAKQLLTEAGYPNGFKTTIYCSAPAADWVTAAQGYLKALSIDADIQPCDSGKLMDYRYNGWKNALVCRTISNSVGSFDSNFSEYPRAVDDRSMARPPGFQAKIDAALTEADDNKRLEIQKDLTKAVFDNATLFPIFAQFELQAHTPTLHDLAWGKGVFNYLEPQNAWLSKK